MMWPDQEPDQSGLPPSNPRLVRIPLPRERVVATWVLLAINITVFVLAYVVSVFMDNGLVQVSNPFCDLYSLRSYECLLSFGWKDNWAIPHGEYWRLLTAMFLHGGLMHMLFNGFALFALGPEMERIYGTLRFVVIYFLAGFAGGIASYIFSPNPSVGASGAIFGLIGGLAVFYYLGRHILGDAGRQQLQSMVVVIVLNLFIGFSAGGIIDNYAHIGGLLGGIASGWLLAPRYQVDTMRYPPVLIRRYSTLNWAGVVGIMLVLVALLMFSQPPVVYVFP